MSKTQGIIAAIVLFVVGLGAGNLFTPTEKSPSEKGPQLKRDSNGNFELTQRIDDLEKALSKERNRIQILEDNLVFLQSKLRENENNPSLTKTNPESEDLKVVSTETEIENKEVKSEESRSQQSWRSRRTRDRKDTDYKDLSKEELVASLKEMSKSRQIKEAISSNRPEAIDFLVENGVDLNREKIDKLPLIVYASSVGNVESIKSLAKYGVHIDSVDHDGYTALHWSKSPEAAKLLIESGANPNYSSLNKETPLHWAQHGDIAKILLDHGANVNAVDHSGRTAIFTLRSRSAMQQVIEAGIDLSVEDNSGKTALDVAIEKNDHTKSKIIKDAGGTQGSKENAGKLIGVGISIDYDNSNPRITSVVQNGPAQLAGIEAGDTILEVAQGYSGERSVSATEKGYRSLSKFIRGPKGSIVQFKVKKKDGSVKTLWIERNVISRSRKKS